MNEKIKSYLTLAGNTINKLPFKKLSEKYSDKVPVLKSIAPFANFIVCGLVVVLILAKIIVPQVKFNSYMSKIEKPWKEEIKSYEALDFSEEFKSAFDKISAEMDNITKEESDIKITNNPLDFTKQLKELKKMKQVKYDDIEELSNLFRKVEKQLNDIIQITLSEKLDEISNKSRAATNDIRNSDSVMSNKQFNKYKKLTEELPVRSMEAREKCISKNNKLYAEYSSSLKTMYTENAEKINASIDKINSVIKEINTTTKIKILDGTKKIEDHAFEYWYSLKEVIIPDSVTEIGESAFDGCESLASVTIPATVTKIGPYAFRQCAFTNIAISPKVREIEEETFNGCKSLTSVTIPEGVIQLGRRAFADCDSLINVTIPTSVTKISNGVFRYSESLKNINYRGSKEQWEQIQIEEHNYDLGRFEEKRIVEGAFDMYKALGLFNARINFNYKGE